MDKASAIPRKRFFIDMFTRDISLADCILDLVDNSIDGLIRDRGLNIAKLLSPESSARPKDGRLPHIEVSTTARSFAISDDCGGMSYRFAKEEVFNFGHPPQYHEENGHSPTLGVYGVGLKRAIFKMGDAFEVVSYPNSGDGFETRVDSLASWVEHDSDLSDWYFPIDKISNPTVSRRGKTRLSITNLRDEVIPLIADGGFLSGLHKDIARVFALFLEQHVRVTINGEVVQPMPIPFGMSEEVTPAFKRLEFDNVDVQLYASLAKRGERNEWVSEQAGWYVACNGRLVVVANKDFITGWGAGALPAFHSKYRGFVGLAHFLSADPYRLPWTTTKRGLNQESLVYQRVRNEMRAICRPVISFLDRMYVGEIAASKPQRDIADSVTQTDLVSIAKGVESPFVVRPKKKTKTKTTVKIQFDAEKADIERVKKHLRDPQLSAGRVGMIAFEDYLKRIDE